MGFVYSWIVRDMPVDRENRCKLEVEEKLKKGLKEILEKHDVKINRGEYIERCISLLWERASLGEYRYRIGKSEFSSLKERKRQYLEEANNVKNKHKYNNSYAQILREHGDALVWVYLTPPNLKIDENILTEIETLYISAFDAVDDEFSFNVLLKGKSNNSNIPEEHQEEICQIYKECRSAKAVQKQFRKNHPETSYTVYRVRKILRKEGHDTSINHTNPPKPLYMCDLKKGEKVKRFDSRASAAEWIYYFGVHKNKSIQSIQSHISNAAKREGVAYEYRWKEAVKEYL